MIRIFYVIALLLLLSHSIQAQVGTLINRMDVFISPSEKRYNSISFNIEDNLQTALYDNPAYFELRNQYLLKHTADSSRHNLKSALLSGYAYGDLNGDYLIQEGNCYNDFRISGIGEYSIASAGTLFGFVRYAKGQHKNIGWNAVRHPEQYAPYISTDSIGGDYRFEEYMIKGGFSFPIKNLYCGIDGFFRGEQAHKKTDPRTLNNTTWLNINLGAGQQFSDGSLWLFNFGAERNKQYQSMKYWRPGQQDRFFVNYGFGLYDVKHSTVSFGYSRMYYITGLKTALTYKTSEKKSVSLFTKLNYQYNYMKTEESSIKDLYFSKTNTINPILILNWKANKSFTYTLQLEYNGKVRKGNENIFEQYIVDQQNNVYDFRQIDTQQNYKKTESVSLIQAKISYKTASAYTLSMMLGSSFFDRDETYKIGNYKIRNQNIEPHFGLGYKLDKKKTELDFNIIMSRNLILNDTYRVDIDNKEIPHLDFQYAFVPYAYYKSEFTSLRLNTTFAYHLSKSTIGINAKLLYTSGDRDKDTQYEGSIGFQSRAPLISKTPDKHNEFWLSSAIFLMF